MSFLDSTGLSYFYSKIKEKFVRSVTTGKDVLSPDENGNITITNVPTADNLTSPDNQTSYDKYIFRTSGGDASLTSGPASLIYIEGDMSIVGRQEEELTASANNGITISINAAAWRASAYGEESGTYTFNYTSSTNTWSPSLSTYGLSAEGVHESSISTYVNSLTISASVDKSIWETQITTAGTYYFIYNGSEWTFNTYPVNLETYGISIEGTPEENNSINVTYSAATPDSVATVTYVKGSQGTIYIPQPTGFSATGFNQCDPSTMVLNDMTISSNGYITGSTGSYVCYCKAVGGVTNGYVAYSVGGHITGIGWCANLPQESSDVILTGASVTSTLASIPFANNGYVVVALDSTVDICIHPKWSGAADTTYEEYIEPSVITFPTIGTRNGSTVQLPLATYGMPAIGAIADKMDLEARIYIQKIGHYTYSAANLATVQALGVPYEYDLNHIYYVLDTPIQYSINVSSFYTVNDWGTEEFIGTVVPVYAQTLYAQNLRDKLRTDVLTISPQVLTINQQGQVYTNLNLKSFHLNDTITTLPHIIEDDRINPMMSAANITFGTQSAIISDVSWVTGTGSIIFSGTLASDMSTSVDFDMAPILSIGSAEIDTAAIEAEVSVFLNGLENTVDAAEASALAEVSAFVADAGETIEFTQAQAASLLTSLNDELEALQSGTAVELKKLQFKNVAVASSAFASDSTYHDYDYRARIDLTEVIENMTPFVMFDMDDALSQNYAPIAECYNGGVYIYSSAVPSSSITIPTIMCWRANS